MPKLKRKSCDQRKLQSKSCMREIREDESTKCVRQEKDRKSKSIKRQDKMIRLHQNNINKICQRKRLSIDENKKTHLIRMKEAQNKRLADEKNKLLHKKKLIECQRKRLSSNENNKLVHKKRLIECQRKRLSINENRQNHQMRNREAQASRLADENKRLLHKKKLIECQRKRLSSDEKNKLVHKKRLIECQRKRLSINENRQNHQMRNREAQASRLADENKRLLHKKKLIECQRKRLSSDEKNKLVHKKRLIECQRKRLSINENRQNHQMRNREAQASRLADENKRLLHKKKLIECQRKRLSSDEKNKLVHKIRLIECQRKRLSINENRQNHQLRNREAQASRLADENKRLLHNKKLIECQRNRLVRENNRVLHKIRLIESQKKRLNISFQYEKHLKQLQKSQHKRLSILSLREGHNERSLQGYYNRVNRNQNNSRANIFEKYNKAIKDGPYWECVSCCRLLFRTSVTFCTTHMFPNVSLRFLKQCCVKMENDSDVGYLCSACKCSIKKNEKPRFSLCHKGLKFPHVSEEVRKLTPLEERFLCPRIPFMQIRTFGGNQQYSVKGRVVNVPTDVAENIEVLPRLPHETDVIPVVLKKKKEYKSNVMFQTVRPNAILDALKVLENCTVYKKANVRIDYNQINKLIELQVEKETIQNESGNEISEIESDSDSEDEPINIPADQTLLNSEAIVFAPGENFQPIPLFMDTDVEAMSFIKIYGGETKDYPNHLSYQKISKSEVMRSDKRVASSIEKLFFSCTYLRAQKVSNSISICMRKSSGKQHATVGTALADDFIRTITVHDSGYKIFAPDRGSPAFWEQKKKELFAMIRQLGPPTFFITLSPAETKWTELLVILKKVIDCIDISEDDALSMQYEEKVRLIKCDPVTCGLYFDYRLRKLINVMKAKDSIFREYELVDSYIRIEFQQRGSPHAHCLIWLKGAPRLIPGNEESMKECETFIDRFISCSNNTTLVSNELIQFQVHKHTFTCWKNKDEKKCRFGIPSFPMKETKILEPLGDSVNEIQLKKHKADFLLIRTWLNEMYQKEQELSFDEFLSKLNLSEESYILAIRSSLKRPKCFLKRSLMEIRTNAYNPEILSLHRSNMDIQFITDVYSCAMYVLNYINKSKGGISKIIRDAMKEVKKGDLTLKEKLRFLANKFLNASEFSAQEAVYYLLSLPLSICSRSTVFINTSPPEKRVSLLKSKRELQQLPTECTDIFKKGVIDHYAERPDDLNGICLAEYAAYYNHSRSNTSKDVDLNEFSDHEIDDIEPRVSTETVKKRQRAKILRYVRYNIENDETNYYREQLMLFLPWRNEQEDVTNVNHKLKFLNFKDTIIGNRAMFIYGDTGDDIVMDVIDAAVNDHVAAENENNEEDNDMNEVVEIMSNNQCSLDCVWMCVSALMPWLASNPSQITQALHTATLIVTHASGTTASPSTNATLIGNPAVNVFMSADSRLTQALQIARLSEMLRRDSAATLDWLKRNSKIELDQVHLYVSALLISHPDSQVRLAALQALVESQAPMASTHTLTLLLFHLPREKEPEIHLALLRALPSTAVDKSNVMGVVSTVEAVRRSGPSQALLAVQLYCQLWMNQERCFPQLMNILNQDLECFGSPCISHMLQANVCKTICEAKPEMHGKELVAKVSDLLNRCSGPRDAPASALALDALVPLCRHDVVDILTIWRSLALRFSKDKRPVVLCSLCELLSVAAVQKSVSEADETLTQILRWLWNLVGSNKHSQVIDSALSALSKYRPDQMSLKLLPECFRRGVTLPPEMVKTPADAARRPEDVLDYVPGECWVQVLEGVGMESASMAVAGWIKMEVSSFKGAKLYQVDRQEPSNYNHLPRQSVVRGVVSSLKNLCNAASSEHVKVINLCLLSLLQPTPKPLPSMSWAFLKDLHTFEDVELTKNVVRLATKQSQISPTARKISEEYINSCENDKDKIEFLYSILIDLSRGIPPIILRPFLEKTLLSALKEKDHNHFSKMVSCIKATLKEEKIHDANRTLLQQQVKLLWDIIDPQSQVLEDYFACAAELPVSLTESMTSTSTMWEVTSAQLQKAFRLRAYMALMPDAQHPLNWLNEMIDVASSNLSEQHLALLLVTQVMTKLRFHETVWQWLRELMGQTHLSSAENKGGLEFLVMVFVICVDIVSGYSSLEAGPCDSASLAQDPRALRFPQAVTRLVSRFGDASSMDEWLSHMCRCETFPAELVVTFQLAARSVSLLRR